MVLLLHQNRQLLKIWHSSLPEAVNSPSLYILRKVFLSERRRRSICSAVLTKIEKSFAQFDFLRRLWAMAVQKFSATIRLVRLLWMAFAHQFEAKAPGKFEELNTLDYTSLPRSEVHRLCCRTLLNFHPVFSFWVLMMILSHKVNAFQTLECMNRQISTSYEWRNILPDMLLMRTNTWARLHGFLLFSDRTTHRLIWV